MRNIRILVIFLLTIYIVAFWQRHFINPSRKIKTPSSFPATTSTLAPFKTQNLNPSNAPTLTPTVFNKTNANDFIYPGSTKISSDSDSFVLQSSDDSQTITEWYKNKISSMGLNAKSFVTTNTNGNILNKLVGANNSLKINVEISKKNSDAVTKISVTSQ